MRQAQPAGAGPGELRQRNGPEEAQVWLAQPSRQTAVTHAQMDVRDQQCATVGSGFCAQIDRAGTMERNAFPSRPLRMQASLFLVQHEGSGRPNQRCRAFNNRTKNVLTSDIRFGVGTGAWHTGF